MIDLTTGNRIMPNRMSTRTSVMGLVKKIEMFPWELIKALRRFDSSIGASTKESSIGAMGYLFLSRI
jgi:hypothetical protein